MCLNYSVTKKFMKLSTRIKRLRRPKLLHIYALLIVVGFTLVGYLYTNTDHAIGTGRLVTFHDRGKDHVILTYASTVQQALEDANIFVAPQDIVEPASSSELNSTDSAVIIYRARPVLIIDGALQERVVTPAQSPNEIVAAAKLKRISPKDKTTLKQADFVTEGAITVLTVKRAAQPRTSTLAVNKPTPYALTKSRGAQFYTDKSGVTHRETYYDLPMNIVISSCGPGDYKVRSDGAKVDKDGYILVAADYAIYPKCTIVETSMGLGKVYDTGGFVARYPHGFDLATDWTNYDGR